MNQKPDLYAELGVAKNADKAEIRRAYKKRAQESHPDKPGGSTEKFQRLQVAYRILSDEELRHRYETLGETNAPVDERSRLLQEIAGLMITAMHTHVNAETTDYVGIVRQAILGMIDSAIKQKQGGTKRKEQYRKVLDRLEHRGEKSDILRKVIEGEMLSLDDMFKHVEQEIAYRKRMLEVLNEYHYVTNPSFTVSFSNLGPQENWLRPSGT